MEGRASGPTGASPPAGSHTTPPLVGRRDVLDQFTRLLNSIGEPASKRAAESTRLVGLAGEPGAGKTRLLQELVADAESRGMLPLAGRAAEFEQEMPFGAVVDALDDHLDTIAEPSGPLGAQTASLLVAVFPALAASGSGETGSQEPADTGLGRYGIYRAVRRLLEEVVPASGLVLILDDLHWADEATIELLDYLVRHPPRGPVLIVVAYRPAQASPRLAALMQAAQPIPVTPLNEAEVEEFLGPGVNRTRREALFAASGGNPFYLEALARMGSEPVSGAGGPGELPPAIRAALRMELSGLPADALLVAQGAAVAADEFEPALAAVAAELPEDRTLDAISELVARDVVRPASAGRFRFRHPLVRHAAYGSAAAGWQLAAHARIAACLAGVGAPATARAHHVERSGRFGDRAAIDTLVAATRAVAAQAPATAAHWLGAALNLLPEDAADRIELLLELARLQAVSGRLQEGRDTAREVLRLLPPADYARRAQAARFGALMERQLDRPHEARALLLDELRRIPGPQSAAALPLRIRLIAESLMRSDFRAAQAVLDMMPENSPGWDPGIRLAVAALRPLPAYAAGRMGDAVRYVEAADRLLATAADEHLAEWPDAIAWLCWTETFLGRHGAARGHFDRAIGVARATGQSYIMSNLLAGRARSDVMLGRLQEAVTAAEDAAEAARLLGSGQQLGFALTQQCLARSWAGDDEDAVRLGAEAVDTGGGGEWWGALARYARALALVNAGDLEQGEPALLDACDGFKAPRLDLGTLIFCCETLARVAALRGRSGEAAEWADRAEQSARPDAETTIGAARLARAHALVEADPMGAAAHALEAAGMFGAADLRIDTGRATMRAGTAYAAAGERGPAVKHLGAAATIFADCGARALHAKAVREQRRLGVRVSSRAAGRGSGPYGLTRREMEVAKLIVDGHTNQQIAERLYLSPRTVETHISHIFAKLGVSSRVAIVSALNRFL
jgi:DNA-binding CsgD family transcriptional regulator/tetratricopeptide (TPR) repeat protein